MIANWPSTTFTPATRPSTSATLLAENFENSSTPTTFSSWSESSRMLIRSSTFSAVTTNSSICVASSSFVVTCGGRGKSARVGSPPFTTKSVMSDLR